MNPYNIVMLQGFESFGFNEYWVDIGCCTYFVCFDNFDRKLLSGLPMPGKLNLPESSFTQFLHKFVLAESASRVKLLSPGGIEDRFILDKWEIVFKVFSPFRVKET